MFSDSGIPVDWRTVHDGLRGPGRLAPQIDLRDVREWLEADLQSGRTLPNAVLVLLAIEDSHEPAELIASLARAAGGNPEVSLQIWQWFLLGKELEHLPSDPFYAVLAIADFWASFDHQWDYPSPTAEALTSAVTEEVRDRIVQDQVDWRVAALGELHHKA
jgi:Uncharacterized protein conserved in bacteria (DUF2247)